MLIWYFSNNLDIYYHVGKLPEQHFSEWLLSNPGDKILFLFKFDEARISEWNINKWKVKLTTLNAPIYSLLPWIKQYHISKPLCYSVLGKKQKKKSFPHCLSKKRASHTVCAYFRLFLVFSSSLLKFLVVTLLNSSFIQKISKNQNKNA